MQGRCFWHQSKARIELPIGLPYFRDITAFVRQKPLFLNCTPILAKISGCSFGVDP